MCCTKVILLSHATESWKKKKNTSPLHVAESPCDEFDPVPELSDPEAWTSDPDFLSHSRSPNLSYSSFTFLTHKEQADMLISIFKHTSLWISLCTFSLLWVLSEFSSSARLILVFRTLGSLGSSEFLTSKCFSNIYLELSNVVRSLKVVLCVLDISAWVDMSFQRYTSHWVAF